MDVPSFWTRAEMEGWRCFPTDDRSRFIASREMRDGSLYTPPSRWRSVGTCVAADDDDPYLLIGLLMVLILLLILLLIYLFVHL